MLLHAMWLKPAAMEMRGAEKLGETSRHTRAARELYDYDPDFPMIGLRFESGSFFLLCVL